MWGKTVLIAIGASLVVGALVAWYVTDLRWQNKYAAEMAKIQDASAKATQESNRIVGEKNAIIADLESRRAKVRIVYRDAVRTDAECKAWSERPISCPVSWR